MPDSHQHLSAEERAAALEILLLERRSGEDRRSGHERREEGASPVWLRIFDGVHKFVVVGAILVGLVAWTARSQASDDARLKALEEGSVRREAAIQSLQIQQEADRRELEAVLRELKSEVSKLNGLLEGQARMVR